MVKLIDVLVFADKVIDCIPLINIPKNVSILLYQSIHKVNKVANPVKTSWKTDLKIHALSKSRFFAAISMIPIAGSLVCMGYYIKDLIYRILGDRPPDPLCYAAARYTCGLEKHGYEVASLFLARNPDYPEEKLQRALCIAANYKNKEIFELIFKIKVDWSTETIFRILQYRANAEIAAIALEKNAHKISKNHLGFLLSGLSRDINGDTYDLFKLFIEKFPAITMENLDAAFKEFASQGDEKLFNLILDKLPDMDEKYKISALKAALNSGEENIIELLLKKFPTLVDTQLEELLITAFRSDNNDIFDWLLSNYEKKIQIKYIENAIKSSLCISKPTLRLISEKYPNIDKNCLEKMMLKNVEDHYAEDFEIYFQFTALDEDLLENILNKLVKNLQELQRHPTYYGQHKNLGEQWDNNKKNAWKKIGKSIFENFSTIKEKNEDIFHYFY